jgi:hypothetical protein
LGGGRGYGIAFELAAILFNIIWWHARRDRRLLTDTLGAAGVKAGRSRVRSPRLDVGVGV